MLNYEVIKESAENAEAIRPPRPSEVESFFKEVFPDGGRNANWEEHRVGYKIQVDVPEKYLYHRNEDSDDDSDDDDDEQEEYSEEKKSEDELVAFMDGVEEVFNENLSCDIAWLTGGSGGDKMSGEGVYDRESYYGNSELAFWILLEMKLTLFVTVYGPA
jgi:hypothetical protein